MNTFSGTLVANTHARKLRRKARISATVRYTLLIVVGIVMIYALLWLIGASFKSNSEMFKSPWFWPREPTMQGYIDGWKTSTPYTFGRFFLNSLWIVITKVIGTAIFCTMVAYGFARFEFPGKKILFGILIMTLLLPDVVTRIPQYLLFHELDWLDIYLPLFVPSWVAADAFFVFMIIQFLRAIPRDFVAGFIGMPEMNLVPAVLNRWRSLTLDDQTVTVEEGLAARISVVDGPVTLGIRPQQLEAVPADSANCFTGVISNLEFMGHEVNLHVRVATAVFVTVIPSERFDKTLERGERAGLTPLVRAFTCSTQVPARTSHWHLMTPDPNGGICT